MDWGTFYVLWSSLQSSVLQGHSHIAKCFTGLGCGTNGTKVFKFKITMLKWLWTYLTCFYPLYGYVYLCEHSLLVCFILKMELEFTFSKFLDWRLTFTSMYIWLSMYIFICNRYKLGILFMFHGCYNGIVTTGIWEVYVYKIEKMDIT